jgi:hypothetical protein
MMRMLRRLFRDRTMDGFNAVNAAMERRAAQAAKTCDICAGVRYECPKCHAEIETHSHEGDYLCATHGFVHPVRCSDGAHINGSGDRHQEVMS